jgi:hypothetical protein
MESVVGTGQVSPTGHHSARESATESAAHGGKDAPVPADSAQANNGSKDIDNAVVNPANDSVDPLAGLTRAGIRASDSPTVTPVVATSSAQPLGAAMAHAPAHRLEADGRGARQAEIDRSTAQLARDEAYSAWPISLADADSNREHLGEWRQWINPAPFLAVLGIERLVSVEPGEESERRSDRRSRS